MFPHSIEHLISFSLEEQLKAARLLADSYERSEKLYASLRIEVPAFAEFLDHVQEECGPCEERLIWFRIYSAIEQERLEGSSRTIKALMVLPSIQDRNVPRLSERRKNKACSFYLELLNDLIMSA